ncbi:hypothetical protein E2I00_019074, partial [Balaenoptera physalus]
SLVSPFVLYAYAQNRSLRGLVPASGSSLCQAFAFFMSFFGLASTLQLLAMALDYSVLYASLMLLLVLAIVLCNLSAMRNLYAMHLRLRRLPRSGPRERAELAAGEREETPPPLEELDHFLLLALMTVLFTMCSLPLIYRAYYGAFKAVHEKNGTAEEIEDLRALRFLSVISIVDPWLFIIFRTSVFRMFFHKIFIRPLMYRNWQSNSCGTNMESSL